MPSALLLDVDGVLCPFGCAEEPEGFQQFFIEDQGWVWTSAENTRRLAKLAEAFELVWCTAWEHDANTLLAPHHELDPLRVVEFGTTKEGGRIYVPPARFGHSWKWPWVSEFIDEHDGPVAWIDDDISPRDRDVIEDNPLVLFVQTQCAVGLTDHHVEELLNFASTHS